MISNYPFSFYSLSKFKFRDQIFTCRIGYNHSLINKLEDKEKNENELLNYYFNLDNDDNLDISSSSSDKLTIGVIPTSVKTLIYSIKPDTLDLNALPNNIKTLIILDHFSMTSNIPNNDIPPFVENLQLGSVFSNVYNIPINLRALSYSGRFDSYITELPCCNHLQYLEFGRSYSKSLSHLLPSLKNLKTLILGKSYLQTIKCGHLPQSIELLSLCCSFEANSLPNGLKVLEIDDKVSVGGKLPNSLKCLIFPQGSNEIFNVGDLPDSLEYIDFGRGKEFNEGFSFIPKNCTELLMGDKFNTDLYDTDYENLPPSLESISFGKSFNQGVPIQCLPSSIKTIIFKNDYKMYKVEHLKKSNIKIYKYDSSSSSNSINSSYAINNFKFLNRFIINPIIFNNYNLN